MNSTLNGSRSGTVAYFSMEICLEPKIPTYSGGLGVLAGDTLRSAADLRVPLVAVTLLHRKGYFEQHIDENGQQHESASVWSPETMLEPVDAIVTIAIAGRDVRVRAWQYTVKGVTGHEVPVYLLDTDLPDNTEWDRGLTDYLYGGDSHYRLCQEVILGMGGAEILRAIGITGDVHYHMNEGHSALLTLMLLEHQLGGRTFDITEADIEAVRTHCVFTTHTPVPAGHDRFPSAQVHHVLGEERTALLARAGGMEDELNMTHLALRFSRFINGVAMRHREVSQGMFPAFPIDAITNGVHATTWTAEPMRTVFDRRIPEWRLDNNYLRYAVSIPLEEIGAAHAAAKKALIDEIAERTGLTLDPAVMTIGFARRATPYKRADLVFSDVARLRAMAERVGPMQIVYGGKAHPADEGGKALIKRIHDVAPELGDKLKLVYLENYEMALAYKLVSGVDLWLNNPMKPLEASGTSGMKAALNGVPSLSVLDGWWVEGHVEGVTGWSIGNNTEEQDAATDANDLYVKLESTILPLFYGLPAGFTEVRRAAIALNGSFFNTQRMVTQYVQNAYFPVRAVKTQSAATVGA